MFNLHIHRKPILTGEVIFDNSQPSLRRKEKIENLNMEIQRINREYPIDATTNLKNQLPGGFLAYPNLKIDAIKKENDERKSKILKPFSFHFVNHLKLMTYPAGTYFLLLNNAQLPLNLFNLFSSALALSKHFNSSL